MHTTTANNCDFIRKQNSKQTIKQRNREIAKYLLLPQANILTYIHTTAKIKYNVANNGCNSK